LSALRDLPVGDSRFADAVGGAPRDDRRVRWKAAVIVVSACSVFSALGSAASPGAGLAARCAASPSAQDLRCVREYRHLLTAAAGGVWPGWTRVPPLL
jgi:hypothetical protein